MRFFVKAIATGFAMSLGSAMFKKVSDKMGLEKEGKEGKKDESNAMKAEVAAEAEDPDCDDRSE